VQLDGEQVRLRDFRHDDLDASMRVVDDDRVTRWLSFDSLTREQQVERLAGAIKRAAEDPPPRVVPRHHDPNRQPHRLRAHRTQRGEGWKLEYAIAADHWGHGYATDAAQAMVTFGFEVLGLHRITAAIGPDNAPSIAVVKSWPSPARADYGITYSPTGHGATPNCTRSSCTNGRCTLRA
jgi:ribosomal-protein-alanine N-acetyltransferase